MLISRSGGPCSAMTRSAQAFTARSCVTSRAAKSCGCPSAAQVPDRLGRPAAADHPVAGPRQALGQRAAQAAGHPRDRDHPDRPLRLRHATYLLDLAPSDWDSDRRTTMIIADRDPPAAPGSARLVVDRVRSADNRATGAGRRREAARDASDHKSIRDCRGCDEHTDDRDGGLAGDGRGCGAGRPLRHPAGATTGSPRRSGRTAGSCSSTARPWTAGRPAAAGRARCRSRRAASTRTAAAAT